MRRCWQRDANKQASRRIVVQGKLAAVPTHHGLSDRKAEPEPARLIHGAGLVSPDEGFQHFGPAVLRNSRTVVRYVDGDVIG